VFAGVQAEVAAGPATSTASTTGTTSSASTASAGTSTEDATASGSPSGSDVVNEAASFLGVPYVWGGSSPSGFDCSGLVQYVYGQLGVTLPRTSQEQVSVGTPVSSLADAEPGDLVFFAGSDGTDASPGHVGIYIGNGQMIDAPETGEDVMIQPVGDPVAIRRILPSATSTAATTPATAGTATAASTTSGASLNTASYQVPAALAPDFLQSAATYHVPVQLLTAVAYQESGFDTTATSSAGAEGLMQLMPSTAAGLGVNPMDPAQAIDGAARLLSSYLGQYQSVPLALAAYNAGPGAVAAAGNTVPAIPQTEAYVQNILGLIGGQAT
jgi:hypothetical protein